MPDYCVDRGVDGAIKPDHVLLARKRKEGQTGLWGVWYGGGNAPGDDDDILTHCILHKRRADGGIPTWTDVCRSEGIEESVTAFLTSKCAASLSTWQAAKLRLTKEVVLGEFKTLRDMYVVCQDADWWEGTFGVSRWDIDARYGTGTNDVEFRIIL